MAKKKGTKRAAKRVREQDFRQIRVCELHQKQPGIFDRAWLKNVTKRLEEFSVHEFTMFCGCKFVDVETMFLKVWRRENEKPLDEIGDGL